MPSTGEQMRSEPTEMRRPQLTDHMWLPPTVEFTGFQKPVIAFPQQSQNVLLSALSGLRSALAPGRCKMDSGLPRVCSQILHMALGLPCGTPVRGPALYTKACMRLLLFGDMAHV